MKLALIVGKQNGDKVVAPKLRGVKDNLDIDCYDNIAVFIENASKRHEMYDRVLVLSTLVTQQSLTDLHRYWGATSRGTAIVLMGKKGKDEALVEWFQKLFYSPAVVGMLVGGTTVQILAEAVLLPPSQLSEKYGIANVIEVQTEQVVVNPDPVVEQAPTPVAPTKAEKRQKGAGKGEKKSLFGSLFGKKNKAVKADVGVVPDAEAEDEMDIPVDDSDYVMEDGGFGDSYEEEVGMEDEGIPVDNFVDTVDNNFGTVTDDMGYVEDTSVDSSDVEMVSDGFEDYVPPVNAFSPDEVDDSMLGGMVVEEDYTTGNTDFIASVETVGDDDVVADIAKGEEEYRKANEQPKVITKVEVREVVRNINTGGGSYNSLKNLYSGKSKKTIIVTGDRGSGITSTALNLAKTFSKKVSVLYFDCDVDNHGLLSYLDYDMFRNFDDTQLSGVKLCKTSRAFDSCVMSYDDNFDILTTDYSCDATDDEIIAAQGIVAERAMDYGVIIVDCPVSRLHCVTDLILTGNTIVCVEGSRRGFMNMLCRLESSPLPMRYKRNIVSRGSLFVTKVSKQTDLKKLSKYVSSVFESDGVNWLEMRSYEFNGKLSDKLLNDVLEG